MNLAHFAANINSIDTIEDMNIVIDLVSKRQKQLKKIANSKVRSTLTEGSRVVVRANGDLGTCTIKEMRRTKCDVETDDGRTFEVPFTMLDINVA